MKMFSSIIFADSYEHPACELTKNRTLASIPFAGRFRLIDFVLSSLVNAGVDNIAVVPKKNFASLEDHLGNGKYWDLDHRNSGLRILSPFFKTANSSEVFMARGKLDALRAVQTHIRHIKEEYIVITNGNVVANIDFDEVFKQHLESGADITAVYSKRSSTESKALELHFEGKKVTAMNYIAEKSEQNKDISLNVYVMKKSLLEDIIHLADTHDYHSFETYALINNVGKLDIQGYEYKGYSRVIYTVGEYYETSMDMLKSEIRAQVFNSKRPVLTRVKDSVPVLYQYNAKIENSLIADGCFIDGTVKDSIIFRNVRVETGAVIKNSIVMQNAVISKNSKLDYVVLDKNTSVSEGKKLNGDKAYPFIIEKGTNIC